MGVILAIAFAITFIATYEGTGSQVRRQIDHDLRQDTSDLLRSGLAGEEDNPADVARAARAYVTGLPSFGGSARLVLMRFSNGQVITNEPDLLGLGPDRNEPREAPDMKAAERQQGNTLLAAAPGLHNYRLRDVGGVRVQVTPVSRRGHILATAVIGEPLSAVERAQDGVATTFLLVGSLTLLVAIGAAYLLAARTAAPLRRMARTAAQVDAGDLAPRIASRGPRDEIRVLADAFDHMLDRLADAFSRQQAFVADASHELRTPLTVIRGQLEVLAAQRDVSRADVDRVEGMVRTEILRMQRLIDELLLLTRADHQELLRTQQLDLEVYLDSLYESLTMLGDRVFKLAPVPRGTLRADPDRLAQVLRNLVLNAVEHTAAGGRVEVAARAARGELEFTVDDDGPGIAAEQRDRIFDRFARTDSARARPAGGTGLGLAIARAIVQAHGGTIQAEASPLGGARIRLTLPGYERSVRQSVSAGDPAPASSGL